MLRHYFELLVAILVLFLLSAVPALAHEGDGANSTAFVLTGRTILVIAAVISIVVTTGLFAIKSRLNLSYVQYGVIGLTTITAVIHILVGLDEFILLLNGLGFLALLAATYVLPQFKAFRNALTWVLLGYTIVTFILYFASHPWGYEHGSLDRLGLATKVVEFVLIGLISIDLWQNRQANRLISATSTD